MITYLTNALEASSMIPASAKSGAGIATPISTDVSASFRNALFLCLHKIIMVGDWVPLRRAASVVGCCNSQSSATLLRLQPDGGSFTNTPQETVMSNSSTTAQVRERYLAPQTLPFVDSDKTNQFWQVQTTGDYVRDCQLGERYAVLALDYMRETGFSPLLGWIVRDMPNDEEAKGVQIGFLSKISQYSITGFGLCGHRELKKADLYLVNKK